MSKHDTNSTPIYSKDGKKEYVTVKKYRCKTCGKGSQVEFKDEFKKNSGLPVELESMIEKLNSLHWISLRDKQKILKLTLGISVVRFLFWVANLYFCFSKCVFASIVNLQV